MWKMLNNKERVWALLNMDEDEGLSLEGRYEMSFVRAKARVWVRLHERMENRWMSSQREVDKHLCVHACACGVCVRRSHQPSCNG